MDPKTIVDQLTRIEEKLDRYQERISKAEADISWIKGFIKVSTSLLITAVAGTITVFYNFITK